MNKNRLQLLIRTIHLYKDCLEPDHWRRLVHERCFEVVHHLAAAGLARRRFLAGSLGNTNYPGSELNSSLMTLPSLCECWLSNISQPVVSLHTRIKVFSCDNAMNNDLVYIIYLVFMTEASVGDKTGVVTLTFAVGDGDGAGDGDGLSCNSGGSLGGGGGGGGGEGNGASGGSGTEAGVQVVSIAASASGGGGGGGGGLGSGLGGELGGGSSSGAGLGGELEDGDGGGRRRALIVAVLLGSKLSVETTLLFNWPCRGASTILLEP